MKIFSQTRKATLEDVSWLRRAIRRELTNLRLPTELVDDVQLAIAELATNAVVHGNPRATEIGINVDIHGATLRIEISDNGGPFAAFQQAFEAASRQLAIAKGTSGLGLALAAAALQKVSYHVGSGTEPNRLIGWRPLVRVRPGVLIVDHDTDLQNAIAGVLNDRYSIYGADSVEAAVSLSNLRAIDLIIADSAFVTGAEGDLIGELGRDAERLPIPIIMLSDVSTPTNKETAAGIERIKSKPLALDKVRAAVDETLSRTSRRLADVFRYCCVSVENLMKAPSEAELASVGACFRSYKATAGGGDFVLHLTNSARERIIIADIIGHDLKAKAAAIAQATLLRTVHGTLSPERDPGYYLWTISRLMHDDPTLAELLLTMVVVDRLPDGTLQIASAGHPKPMLITATKSEIVNVGGPLLGFAARATYPMVQLKLEKRQRLVLLTDGVEPFAAASGTDVPKGLIETIRKSARLPLQMATEAAEKWALDIHGPAPLDDWTIMLMENPTS